MKLGWKLPVLAGVLIGLGYFPGPFLPLNLAGMLPLLFWFEQHPRRSGYDVLRVGFLFGLTTQLVALHFMYSMLEQSILAVLLYLGMSALIGARMALAVLVAGWLRKRTGGSWAWILPLSWLPFEWLQSWGDLRMTGEHLSHTVADHPFVVQFADLVGPYGVGAVLLVTNGLLFEAAMLRRRRAAIVLIVLWLAIVGYDSWRWFDDGPAPRTLRVALIQPNIPLAVKHDPATNALQWETLSRMSAEAAGQGADLIVWPESARPNAVIHDLDRGQTGEMFDVQMLARRLQTPMIVGAEYLRHRSGGEREAYNAVFAVTAEGELLEQWGAKRFLVPFVEATPFRRLTAPLVEGREGEWRWLSGGFEMGPPHQPFEIAGARIGVLVCYEQLFFDLARDLRNRGAEAQVVITNDAWFGRSLFQAYQADALRMRAIENRTAYVRVANTGISGFVDSRGRYHEMTGLFTEEIRLWDLPLDEARTLYNRTGNVVAWAAIAGLIAALLIGLRRREPMLS